MKRLILGNRSIEKVSKMEDKKRAVNLLKKQLLEKGVEKYSSLESTIIQVLKDILDDKNSFVDRAERIKSGWAVKSVVSLMDGQATEIQYEQEKYQMYCDLIDEVNNYIDLYNGETKNEHFDDEKINTCIFLSYCWEDSETADKIETYFTDRGIEIKRDIRDIGEWKSIRKFMESIRNQDYAVFIISDKYLKSTNCMFEVLEMMKEQVYKEKIFPVVLESKVYDPLERVEYIKYWEHEYKKLEQAVKSIDICSSPELVLELRKVKQICVSISEFMGLISNMNNPKIDNVNKAIENRLKEKRAFIPLKTVLSAPNLSSKTQETNYEEIVGLVLENPIENWNYFDEYGEYILKDDINLKIIRDDFEKRQPFYEQWAVHHPDPHADMYKYSIFYNDSRVDEFYLVAVDGGRAYIPMPKVNTNFISLKDYLLAKAVNDDGRLDEYISRSGLVVEKN